MVFSEYKRADFIPHLTEVLERTGWGFGHTGSNGNDSMGLAGERVQESL